MQENLIHRGTSIINQNKSETNTSSLSTGEERKRKSTTCDGDRGIVVLGLDLIPLPLHQLTLHPLAQRARHLHHPHRHVELLGVRLRLHSVAAAESNGRNRRRVVLREAKKPAGRGRAGGEAGSEGGVENESTAEAGAGAVARGKDASLEISSDLGEINSMKEPGHFYAGLLKERKGGIECGEVSLRSMRKDAC